MPVVYFGLRKMRKNKILTIYYGTEMHACYQNNATLKRIEEVYKKKTSGYFNGEG